MSKFSIQVEAEDRVPRRAVERVEEDLNLFLELRERLTSREANRLTAELAELLTSADEGDPHAIHLATGEPTDSPAEQARLALASLGEYFTTRRALLRETITGPEVADVLGISRQAVAARAQRGSLLGILDRGAFRFPTFQLDPRGPDGLVAGLAAALKALEPQPALAKLVWLTRPNPALAGLEPIEALRRGEDERVAAAARAASELP